MCVASRGDNPIINLRLSVYICVWRRTSAGGCGRLRSRGGRGRRLCWCRGRSQGLSARGCRCGSEGGSLSGREGRRGSGGFRGRCRAGGRRRVGASGSGSGCGCVGARSGRSGREGGGLSGRMGGGLCRGGGEPWRRHGEGDEAQHIAGYGHTHDSEEKTVDYLLSLWKAAVPITHAVPRYLSADLGAAATLLWLARRLQWFGENGSPPQKCSASCRLALHR